MSDPAAAGPLVAMSRRSAWMSDSNDDVPGPVKTIAVEQRGESRCVVAQAHLQDHAEVVVRDEAISLVRSRP